MPASRPCSTDTSVSGARAARAQRRWGSSSSRPTTTALKGRIFRIGHIGYFDVFDITTALAAVEIVLADLGAEIERGVAVTRALEAFEERARV